MALQLSPLAKYFLAAMLAKGTAGSSVYSMEPMPECGANPKVPVCQIERVCESQSPLCAPPRWSKSRSAWVKCETREAAAARMERAAYALTRASVWLTRCKDGDGNVVEECKAVNWPQGPRSLGTAALSSSVWESGYREDIMGGYAPAGRGTQGEACVMQVMPEYIAQYADWEPAGDPEEMTSEDWAQEILGDDVESLERCYRVGMRMLVRFGRSARHKCRGAPIHGMYAFYGNGGNSCGGSTEALGSYAEKRAKTYYNLMKSWPNKLGIPEWAVVTYGQIEGYTESTERSRRRGPYADRPSRGGGPPLVVINSD